MRLSRARQAMGRCEFNDFYEAVASKMDNFIRKSSKAKSENQNLNGVGLNFYDHQYLIGRFNIGGLQFCTSLSEAKAKNPKLTIVKRMVSCDSGSEFIYYPLVASPFIEFDCGLPVYHGCSMVTGGVLDEKSI